MSYERRDLHIHRTSCNTARVLAVETSCGFELSFLYIISIAYLFKVGSSHFRILFANRYSWYLVSHYLPLPILHL